MKRKQSDNKESKLVEILVDRFPICVAAMIESYCMYGLRTLFEKKFRRDSNCYSTELVAIDRINWTNSKGPHYFLRRVDTTSPITPNKVVFCDYGNYQAYECCKEPRLSNHIYVFTPCENFTSI